MSEIKIEDNQKRTTTMSEEERIRLLEKFREFTKDSTLTEEDAIELGRKVKKRLNQRFKSNN